jgi:hypothetical protein
VDRFDTGDFSECKVPPNHRGTTSAPLPASRTFFGQ